MGDSIGVMEQRLCHMSTLQELLDVCQSRHGRSLVPRQRY
jgi:hypothetical protein